ncbi:MAG TPA: BtrH N-terminal domain-containing protein [Lachnospiraceae bacterium]|nr:BtrH N-terminal domain-containing protein [Lachnospiraceae bacterium]
MSRVEIEVKHHLCSGCCMWSGIEDVYCTRKGVDVPEGFFFMMASFAEAKYLKYPSREIARMFSVGDGTPTHTYGNMKEILGLSYHICGEETYEQALCNVQKEIDGGNPVVMGPLDMYHLPYLKMYHQYHIPIHYVLMVGYDTEKESVLIYDCDRENLIELSNSELEKAWNVEKNVVGDCNGYVKFQLAKELKDPQQILLDSMKRKAVTQLAEKPYMIGVTAFQKAAKDFPNWKKELTEESYRTTLMHLPEYWGRVPKLPNRFFGAPQESKDIPFQANMDRFAYCLDAMGLKCGNETYRNAAALFAKSGHLYQDITDRIVKYVCDGADTLSEVPSLLLQIASLYEEAYRLFL